MWDNQTLIDGDLLAACGMKLYINKCAVGQGKIPILIE